MKMTHNIEQSAAKITDPKQRKNLLAELRLIRTITDNDNLCYLEEVLNLVGCDTSRVQLNASSFIQNYAQTLGWSSVELAGEILSRLEKSGKLFSREMLYRCLLDVYKKHPGRIWITDPGILLSMLNELPKDIAAANESAASHVDPQLPPGFPGVLPQRVEFITLTVALKCWNAIDLYPWDRPIFPIPSSAVLDGIHKVLRILWGHGPDAEEREELEGMGRLLARISSKLP